MEVSEKKYKGGDEMEKGFEKIAEENFEIWNEALQSKDPRKVANLYTEDAAFLPTMSPEFKKGTTGAEEYFSHFLEKNPSGVIKEWSSVQPEGENFYSHNGMYDFELDGPEGKRVVVAARFTFNWRKEADGKWRISAHHSSVLPIK